MRQLSLLGRVEIRDTAGARRIDPTTRQSSVAILAYLAAAQPRGPHSLAELQLQLDGEDAYCLETVVADLRALLPSDVLEVRGDGTLALSHQHIALDLTTFEQAVTAGDIEAARACYRGDFAEGVSVPDAPLLDAWLDDQRRRYRQLMAALEGTEARVRGRGAPTADAAGEVRSRLTQALAGRYDIEREIGAGGMGRVYLADDLRHHRPVAVKVLHPHLHAAGGADRFLREIEVTAHLQHPNILPLFDSGSDGDLLYFVTPFIDGESLQQRMLRDRQLRLTEVLRIAGGVAAGLDFAHAHGVLHRDIKPANILLQDDRVIIADFGLARVTDSVDVDGLTESGIAVGTPEYMSPEQASAGVVDRGTDIYALGCVVYEMLAGEPPFTGPSRQAIIMKHLGEPAPSVRVLRPALSGAADRAIRVALRKNAADRHESATALVEALGRRRRVSPMAITALVAAGVALVWLAGRAIEGLGSGAVLMDTTHYAVMPFTSEATPPAFNAAELTHDALARWDGVAVVPPLDVRDAVAGGNGNTITPAAAVRLARRVDAGRFVRGDVQAVGDSFRIQASVYATSDGQRLYSATVRTGPERPDLGAAFASLTDSLLFRGTPPGAAPSPATTRSLPARQAFDSGRRHLDAWDLHRADSALSLATAFDADFAQAYLWLAAVRVWERTDPAEWRVAAEQARLGRDRLDAADAGLMNAVLALADHDFGGACAAWRRLTQTRPRDFAGWYGLAECELYDEAVLPDPTSPSGWRFRTRYTDAFAAYRRAFELNPAILVSFRAGAYESLQGMLMTSGVERRRGRALLPDTLTFMADPEWHDGELVLIPYPAAVVEARGFAAAPSDQKRAVHEQRVLFRDVALTWVGSNPTSGDAMEALAIAMAMLGDPAALDTLARARALANAPATRSRMAITEAQLQLLYGLPWDSRRIRRARELADSLLARPQPEADDDPWFLAGLAALTGRAARAAELSRHRQAVETIGAPPTLRQTAPALLVFSALGGPEDSLVVLEDRVANAIDEGLLPETRDAARAQWLARAASLAYPNHRFAGLSALAAIDRIVKLQDAMETGDTAAVNQGLAASRANRSGFDPATLTLDGLYPDAALYVLLGRPEDAAAAVDPTLRTLNRMAPSMIGNPVHAATLVRLAALRATIAEQLGDLEEARRWAEAVVILWSDADDFLHSTVNEMERIVRRASN